jgi:hypothetical protein
MVKVVCFVTEQTIILKQEIIEELKRMDVGVARRSQMMTVEMNVDTTHVNVSNSTSKKMGVASELIICHYYDGAINYTTVHAIIAIE